jgi:gamma-glutamylcyclotransferase (GGCT)/AIG2-like uncharacterized protein YtfP
LTGLSTSRLFVYGTLAPGSVAWSVLEPWVVGPPVADAVPGNLYDTHRGYPAATFGSGPALVQGAVVELREPAVALAALDRYEGDEYTRTRVRTQAGLDVVTYGWIASLSGCRPIEGGRWRDTEAELPKLRRRAADEHP